MCYILVTLELVLNYMEKRILNKFQKHEILFVIIFIVCFLLLALVELTDPLFYVVMNIQEYLVFHNIIEAFSGAVSFSIFGIGWYSYNLSRDKRSLFLGVAFLGIGILDMMHALSYMGMPAFITPNSVNKASSFWIVARYFTAISFFASAYIFNNNDRPMRWISKKILSLINAIIVGLFFVGYIYFPSYLPAAFVEGVGLTPFKIYSEYIICIILLMTFFAYYWRRKLSNTRIYYYFMSGIIVSLFGELSFTLYASVYDTYNALGHIYKLFAFLLIYHGLFKSAIEEPYVHVLESTRLQRDAEERYKILFNSGNDAIFVVDIDKHGNPGKVINVNDVACKIYGYTRQEFLNISPAQFDEPKIFKKNAIPAIKNLINEGKSTFETVHLTKEGKKIPVEINASIFEMNGKKLIFSIARDISERKKTENRLKELDLLKDEFLTITTHELKTPLIPIKSQAQLLLAGDYGKLTTEQKEAIAMILRNEESLNILTAELLDLVKMKSNKLVISKKRTSLLNLVNEVVSDLMTFAKENHIELNIEYKDHVPDLMIDEQKIRQVINNLLTNAIKFTNEGGKVIIKVDNTPKSVDMLIKDTGIGIAEENLSKLFTPFFQVDSSLSRKYRGTGLGLATSKGIIEAHDGKIWGDSNGLGKGSTFGFSLPIKNKQLSKGE